MLTLRLPAWAIQPNHRKKVIATSKGWVVESTGEVLRRVDDLPNKLQQLTEQIRQETDESVARLSEVFNNSTDLDTLLDSIPNSSIVPDDDEEEDEPSKSFGIPEPFDASEIDVKFDMKESQKDFDLSILAGDTTVTSTLVSGEGVIAVNPNPPSMVQESKDEPPAKRPRGRPRKNPVLNTSTKTTRRGRKKKQSSETTDEANEG